ncbi:hypothetical protein [Thermomonospora umbrina]|uniref:Uncharacterized protein n=1 Tax=Thermomonospora umbrina TaxID=111806 RepID=A0A3D9SUA6_9ACTN|nr:hypothetical protein [Thermomonospora umbrina]REE99542.1 hypothetical protein DFJ69_5055 [Thermomonospora umbrina]
MTDENDERRVAGPEAGEARPESPPPPLPQPPTLPASPPVWREPRRSWAGRRSVQLLAAGLAGVIVGGGLVGLVDVVNNDDDGDRFVRVVERGGPFAPERRRWERDPYERWGEPAPPPGWDGFRRFPTPEEEPTVSPSPTG